MDTLRSLIDNGTWLPGTQLPGEADLCKLFTVSRTVIRQALAELDHEGLIVRKKGKGTFVAEPKIGESLVQRLTGFYEDMVERGHIPITQILRQQITPASSKVALKLDVAAGTPLIEIERLRFIENEPIVLVTTFLPFSLCPDVATSDFSSQSLYQFLEKHYGFIIARGHRTIEAVAANEYEAQHLNVEIGMPLILLKSVSYLDNGTPLEYYHARHRGDRSQFEVELVRVRAQGNVRSVLGGDSSTLPPSN
jgi:GntR family transcriptional regulator